MQCVVQTFTLFDSEYSQNTEQPILGSLWDEAQQNDYKGKLRFDAGYFNLNTIWPETPEIFRRQFEWLGAHHHINTMSPFTKNRKYFPGSGSAAWILDEQENTPETIALWDYYKNNYELIGIPTNFIYSESNLNELLALIKEHLKNTLKWRHAFVGGPRLQSSQKYLHLLGGENEWKTYTFCWPFLNFSNENGNARSWHGVDSALEKFTDDRHMQGKRGKEESHNRKNLMRMLEFSNCTYPSFEIGKLLKN